eukprot:scaffold161877_cov51-Attheya_sp.AAC.1
MSMFRVITYDYLNFDRSEAGSSLSDLLSVDSSETNGESSTGSTPTPPGGTQKHFQKKMSNDQVRICLEEAFYNKARVIDTANGLGKLFTPGALLTESSFVGGRKSRSSSNYYSSPRPFH